MVEAPSNYPIVRRITSDDGRMLREARLAALSESPSAFASSYQSEAGRTDDQWEARARAGAAGADRVTFLAVAGGDQVVGLISAFRTDDDQTLVEIVSMWTCPTARRSGTGSALASAALTWAKDCSASTVHLWVTRDNQPARQLYKSMGFRETGESQPLSSDGSLVEVGMSLEL